VPLQAIVKITPSVAVLGVRGIILGRVQQSSKRIAGRCIPAHALHILGWRGNLKDSFEDDLWRTLVANRSTVGKAAPTWYRRACASAFSRLNEEGNLDIQKLLTTASQPSAMIEYLKRFVVMSTGHLTSLKMPILIWRMVKHWLALAHPILRIWI
jgi:hypothetical protein